MKAARACWLVVLALMLLGARTAAHHAFSPVYDEKRVITVDGVVKEFRFVNPHAIMLIEVTDATGKVVPWSVEFAGRLNLEEGGWTANSIKPGERVKITGNPTHTGSQRMFFRRLVRADGSELLPTGPQRLKSIEEERRRRASERSKKN